MPAGSASAASNISRTRGQWSGIAKCHASIADLACSAVPSGRRALTISGARVLRKYSGALSIAAATPIVVWMHHAIWDYWPNERKGRRVTIKGDRPR